MKYDILRIRIEGILRQEYHENPGLKEALERDKSTEPSLDIIMDEIMKLIKENEVI
jgi:hypothetical protein